MTRARGTLLCVAAVVGLASTLCAAAEFGDRDAYVIHDAFFDPSLRSSLRLLVGENLRLEPSSAAPLDTLATLYDGDSGSLKGGARGFLAFDGSRVELAYTLAAWRRAQNVSFTAAEPAGHPATVELTMDERAGAALRTLRLSRRVVERLRDTVLAEYAARLPEAPDGAQLRLRYLAHSSHARLGEFRIDDLGRLRPAAGPVIGRLEAWMASSGATECPRIRARFEPLGNASARQRLEALLPPPHREFKSRLVYWHSVSNRAQGYTTHSLILQVDDTGEPLIDLVRAWLVLPDAPKKPMPLVVLPQQGHIYGALEPLGVLGETELDMAGDLARNGVASVAFDSVIFGILNASSPYFYFRQYPKSGTTAKEIDNLRRLVDQLFDPRFESIAGVQFDRQHVGIWGFSYGAWVSLVFAAVDPRITTVAFSSFHYHDRDIARGLSISLYIPHLACFTEGGDPPVSVRKIVAEYDRDVLAIVPDVGLLKEWTEGLHDKRVVVLANPFGHVVTESERAHVLGFFYREFGIAARPMPRGPVHELAASPQETAPYDKRDSHWRELLVRAMQRSP